MRNFWLVAVIIILFTLILNAIIINIPQDYQNIQDGINISENGDTILIQPGTYFEGIDFLGKNITVASLFLITQDTMYIENTVLDATDQYRGVTFEHQEDSTAVLCGLTIKNGDNPYGAGIYCFDHSSPTILYCDITDNNSAVGGAFYGNYSSAKLINSKFRNSTNSGGIYLANHSDVLIKNCLIENNGTVDRGGGIYADFYSEPTIINSKIINNTANVYGGGIYSYRSNIHLENCIIQNNHAYYEAGGIYAENISFFEINDCIIKSNYTNNDAGGLYMKNTDFYISNSQIIDNVSDYSAGGIKIKNCDDSYISDTIIKNNYTVRNGGGLYLYNSQNLNLSNVTIKNNHSESAAALYLNSSGILFDSANRCNIYNNGDTGFSKGRGIEITLSSSPHLNVIVDTFTVFNPSDYYVSSNTENNVTFDILHSTMGNLINSDLYVSPNGDNTNSGTSPDSPFKSLDYAVRHIYTDSENPHTIYLEAGTFSFVNTLEKFPIYPNSYLTLQGISPEETIIDANHQNAIFVIRNSHNVLLKNLTLKKGSNSQGGGISCISSDLTINNCIIRDCLATAGGGFQQLMGETKIINTKFINNRAYYNGGAINMYSGQSIIINSLFYDNFSTKAGALDLNFSNVSIINSTFNNNTANDICGAVLIEESSQISIINSILYGDSPQEIAFYTRNTLSGTLDANYNDIQGGYEGILQNDYSEINTFTFNIDENPLYIAPQEYNYQLSENSPCIDAGTQNLPSEIEFPDYDLAGNPRFTGYSIDMGAYEYFSSESDILELQSGEYIKNYPNPFNPITTITYQIKEKSDVKIEIYNLKGQLLKVYKKYHNIGGEYKYTWNACSKNQKISSSIYFYKFTVNGKTKAIKKMCLLK